MATAIYVISNSAEGAQRYKVGSHCGDINKLRARYITALPDLIIHYFIATPHAKVVESRFKQKHVGSRTMNANGRLSEWVNMSLEEIFTSLSVLIMECYIERVNETLVASIPDVRILVTSPESVTENQRKNMSSFEVFLEEETQPTMTAEDKTPFSELWIRYQQSCKKHSFAPITSTEFGKRLKAKGYRSHKSGVIYYYGIRLITL